MKIAVFYIATGRYQFFWKDFYESCQKYFIPGAEKSYYVFTDALQIAGEENVNVHRVSHQKLGWPYDTLMRFEVFLKVEQELKKVDFVFFFNANMRFVQIVTAAEFLPQADNDGLLVVQHPGQYSFNPGQFTYDRNPLSQAYVAPGSEGKFYVMGGLNGGTAEAYLSLIHELDRRIKEDLKNGVIALWHDESHLNKYILDKHPRVLTPAYGYPEGRKLPFDPKIIIQDKRKYGGHKFLRRSGEMTMAQWLTAQWVKSMYFLLSFAKKMFK